MKPYKFGGVMAGLAELSIDQRAFLSVDTSDLGRAKELAALAKRAGAQVIKIGLEFSTATSWATCAAVAEEENLDWVADAKLHDIPNTTEGAVTNISRLSHPPLGITIHTKSGVDSMRAAQEVAGPVGITMLGVTHLTSISDEETKVTYGFLRRTLVRRQMDRALEAGIGGYVMSARELPNVIGKHPEFQHMFGMIPGTRSKGVAANDQKNTDTPFAAMAYGASALVIGRQVTGASIPAQAFTDVIAEMREGSAHSVNSRKVA